ncbi:hypothetical protein RIF29_11347 [Crotalaria pallida]|uniref:Uncharacterized protein n=1 Tax=Crotalaria pallida TaxID=3830 RepID=A0AAN9IM15_CROPI
MCRLLDSCCAAFAEAQKRGKEFWAEFELHAFDLLAGIVVDIALVVLRWTGSIDEQKIAQFDPLPYFRSVEISEETKTEWSEKESLCLLEAITHYGDDWRSVAQHVGGRTEKDCVSHFLKLPFGDQFLQSQDPAMTEDNEPSKRMSLTPLSNASNPIMAQAAFLSVLAGLGASQAAAQAAVATLSDMLALHLTAVVLQMHFKNLVACKCTQLEKEESDLEKAIYDIMEVQSCRVHDLQAFMHLDFHFPVRSCRILDLMKSYALTFSKINLIT